MIMSFSKHSISWRPLWPMSSASNKSFCRQTLLHCIVPVLLGVSIVSSACAATDQETFSVSSTAGNTLEVSSLGKFNRPWAMSFLPTGELLITEKDGRLWMVRASSAENNSSFAIVAPETIERVEVSGLPEVRAGGQGGLGDIVVHPDYADNGYIYISYVEREGGTSGAAVIRARLDLSDPDSPRLADQQDIWRQVPKVSGEGHYGHRLAFSPDGYLYISSGERQKFDPAQNMEMNLGKVIRLFDDGSVPADNPWADQGDVAAQFWSIGHRNPLGLAFAEDGQLWEHEMGPRGGDEFNRIVAGANYGYPLVSNGSHYDGSPIPDHDTRADLQAPEASWSPVISPSGLVIYRGERYADWEGTALMGGLSSQSLVRVSLGESVSEIERYNMGHRIREVEQDIDDVVYLLEDGPDGRLLRLSMP